MKGQRLMFGKLKTVVQPTRTLQGILAITGLEEDDDDFDPIEPPDIPPTYKRNIKFENAPLPSLDGKDDNTRPMEKEETDSAVPEGVSTLMELLNLRHWF